MARQTWFTPERRALVSEENKQLYEKYYQSCTIKNIDVVKTTFKTYKENFWQFLTFLSVYQDNVGLYSKRFMEDAVDIMEEYISFCQTELKNGKKTINNKIAAVSTFYIWSLKRRLIDAHPFDKKLDRIKYAKDEHIIKPHFLTREQVDIIRDELKNNTKTFDIQDKILFEVAIDSANRIGALERLTLSSLDIDNMVFTDIREKRGYKVEVIFENYAKELILKWLEMRQSGYDKLEVDSLLITYYGNKYHPMKRGTIHYRMRKYGLLLGISNFHCHSVRKSALDLVYRESGDLFLASKLANHQSTQTTVDSYIKPIGQREIRDKINALKEKNKQQIGGGINA